MLRWAGRSTRLPRWPAWPRASWERKPHERANDCRWWALSPLMQRVLAEAPQAAGDDALRATLAPINSPFTGSALSSGEPTHA